MTRPLALMLAIIAATWDAWRWYVARIVATPEEAAALVLTIAFIIALGWRDRERLAAMAPVALPLWTASGLLVLYVASFGVLPPIGRAAIAISAALLCLYTGLLRAHPPIAFWGLVALSLPVLPSLQFTFGYGMRIVSAALTVVLLQAQGLDVAQQGTFLVWRGEMVQFDAPCSGVNMLWAGLLVGLMGALAQGLCLLRTALIVALSIVLTIAGNVLRASSLFFVETGLVTGLPAWGHEAVGIMAFLMSAGGLLWVLRRLDQAHQDMRSIAP